MAGRPRTDIGTYGKIHFREIRPGVVEARTRFRMRNGRLPLVSRRGPSETAAERRLKKALTKLANDGSKTITGDTKMSRVMDLWWEGLRDRVDRGKLTERTHQEYGYTITNHLKPRMGELTCREAEHAGLVNEVLKEIRKASAAANSTRGKTGTAAMLRARAVLSGVCGLAVLHQAMDVNPVKSVEKIDRDESEILVLEPSQRRDFLDKFAAGCIAEVEGKKRIGLRAKAWTDLPELVEAMLATGLRPGEALALTGDGTDLTERKVLADHHLVRLPKLGMQRVSRRKGNKAGVEPGIPSWALPMFRRRKLESGGGPLFPSWNDQWEDPGNVSKRIRKICDAIGYPWVSARIFRHTTGTHIVDSGLTSEDAADALGNTVKVVEKHYRRPRKHNPKIRDALESMMDSETESS